MNVTPLASKQGWGPFSLCADCLRVSKFDGFVNENFDEADCYVCGGERCSCKACNEAIRQLNSPECDQVDGVVITPEERRRWTPYRGIR